jgi:hypothetical protein
MKSAQVHGFRFFFQVIANLNEPNQAHKYDEAKTIWDMHKNIHPIRFCFGSLAIPKIFLAQARTFRFSKTTSVSFAHVSSAKIIG